MEGGGRGESGARDEFFSEAQELVDGLGRDLLMLDELLKKGQSDAELINDVFRGVHTLKGLSGLFGATRMAGLSHELEDVLDDLRLGRIDLTHPVLDLLFQAVSLYARILSAEKGETAEPGARRRAAPRGARPGLRQAHRAATPASSPSTISTPGSSACSPSTRSTACAPTSSMGSASTASACVSRSRRSTPRSTSSRRTRGPTARSSRTCPPAPAPTSTRSSSRS